MGDGTSFDLEEIVNCRPINESLLTGGQPTDEQLRGLCKLGFELVINVAPYDSRYSINDEPGLVASLGMGYLHHPIAFDAPEINDYFHVEALLDRSMGKRIFIHCAANYRVSVLAGTYAVKRLGWTVQQRDDLIRGIWNIDEYPVWSELIKKISVEK